MIHSLRNAWTPQIQGLWIQIVAGRVELALQITHSEFRSCNGHRSGSATRMELAGHMSHMPFVT